MSDEVDRAENTDMVDMRRSGGDDAATDDGCEGGSVEWWETCG